MSDVQTAQSAQDPKAQPQAQPKDQARRGSYSRVEAGGMTIESNTNTPAEIKRSLETDEEKAERETTAKEAGKLGAAAKKARADERAKLEAEKEDEGEPEKAGEKPEQKAKEGEEDGAEAEKDAKGDEEDEPERKRARTAKARIHELTREKYEAQRAAAAERDARMRLESEVARMRQGGAPQGQQGQAGADPRQQAGSQKPKPEDYQTDSEYVEAVAGWAAGEATRRVERQAQMQHHYQQEMAKRAQVEQTFTERSNSFRDRLAKAREADPKLGERIDPELASLMPGPKARAMGLPLSNDTLVADKILASEVAPQLLLYLSEHKNEFQRIRSLPNPFHVGEALARIEGRIEASQGVASVSTPERSKAHPPFKPVAGASVAADLLSNPDALSDDEYLKRRFSQRKAAR